MLPVNGAGPGWTRVEAAVPYQLSFFSILAFFFRSSI
jgi:hypothetical protein